MLTGKGIFSEESNNVIPVILKQPNLKNLVLIQNEFFPLAKPFDYFVKIPVFTVSKKTFKIPSIMGKGRLTAKDLAQFLESNNAKIQPLKADEIASIYIQEARHEGVNADVAFSQMCLETGFMQFNGDVKPGQHNFCGLGVTRKGAQGLSFSNIRIGIRAHIQHLKAYASTEKINHQIVDKRFSLVRRGVVKNIDDLSGRWASDKQYSKKIISLMKRLYSENNL
ncbi:MAG: glucosaminidase domain-containing protein [Bacteroidales bacterium]|nr:glucosaminidase domain-containing protein [Bacteroidales bacterium]